MSSKHRGLAGRTSASRQGWRVLVGSLCLLGATLLLAGCNVFDTIDTSLVTRPIEDRIAEGKLALASGEFSRAMEIFNALYSEGERSSEVCIGRGEAMAGAAGFNLLTALDILQNGTGPYDHAPVIFGLARMIADRDLLAQGIKALRDAPSVPRADRLARGLWALAWSARLLLDKFDTNHNGRFDHADQIDYTVNDARVSAWPQMYQNLVSGPAPAAQTLEQTYVDLFEGFNGRGTTWTFLTPVADTSLSGTFSESNRNTILAVGDLVERLDLVNLYYETNEASFTTAVRNLDGAEAP
ncbi:MAG TPA: hypothetical protein PKO06_00340 [Candidatus Ozemobacteraceae bacterium]|nr:hypothetical protein [Candidatus Ozemobacteraceae bacterium]